MMRQQNQVSGVVRAIATAAGSALFLLPLFFLLTMGASAADGKPQPAMTEANPASIEDDCATNSLVPAAECLALVELYSQTNGTGWISRTHWLQFGANAPCGWHGVVCSDGHVRQLLLAGNALSGTLPLSLGNLPELRRLNLRNNALQGRIPPTICALANLENLGLDYNALFTQRQSVEDCLTPLAGDWQATQTTRVVNLRVTEIATDALHLAWTPISYTEDGGYYEVGLATEINGPYTLHGATSDKLVASYVVTGLDPGAAYYLRVRSFTSPHGNQPSAVTSLATQVAAATRALSGRVLVAAFFAADNDLSPEIPYVVERMRRGSANNPNVQVVLLVDGREDGDTHVLEIANGLVFTTTAVMDEWGLDELDTSDPDVLAWFLQTARAEFPAERSVVSIIGHGIALAPEVDWPQQAMGAATTINDLPAGTIPPLPKEHDYSPSDVTNRGYMSAVDVGRALMAATDNGANPFDVIFFDQCFQGSLDVLYEVRNSAKVYVASPNYAWLVAAYDRYFTRFVPTASPGDMAQAIINNYEASLNNQHPNAIFWIRNSDLLAIAAEINVLADALTLAAQANEHAKIANAAQQSQYVDTTQCGRQNLQLGPPDELIGIENFGARLRDAFGLADPYGVATALAALEPLLATVSKHSIAGNPYLAPDELWDYANSLTILAPLPRNASPGVAWRASIYRVDTPFAATWSVDPTQPISVTESLAFVRDGRWDEFLDEWYVGLTPTVGQWCQYMPPMQVVVSETEMLTLTASAIHTGTLALAWTPTDDNSAIEYWLYAQDPYAISWRKDRVVPLNQVTLNLANLDGGDYRYRVVARNSEDETIAQSNEITVTVTGAVTASVLMPLLLPLVMRD